MWRPGFLDFLCFFFYFGPISHPFSFLFVISIFLYSNISEPRARARVGNQRNRYNFFSSSPRISALDHVPSIGSKRFFYTMFDLCPSGAGW
jgi:hypothetical protein